MTTVRKLFLLAAAFGLWAGGSVMAETKPSSKTATQIDNQKLADNVAATLKASGATSGAKISIETRDGTVDLSGTVTSDAQHQDILQSLKKVPGLRRIESGLTVASAMPAPAFMPEAPRPMPVAVPPSASPFTRVTSDEPAVLRGGGGHVMEPMPLNGGMAMAAVEPTGPNMPGYAWPTYAPYNNYSRVAYPASYPYNAFPYIGPFYPFPKVPLGWRKVVLEWDDGHWFMGRITPPHDYWRVRFW